MTKKCANGAGVRGNTGTPAKTNACKRYCFTLNNYTIEELNKITECAKCAKINKYIIGKEIGENGTPHLQGFIELKVKERITGLKKWDGWERCHFENAKGNDDSQIYCAKDGDYITNMNFPKPIKIIDKLFLWQSKLETILLNCNSDRTIYWIYDANGCTGKTCFLKYLVVKYKCIFTTGGKNNDIINLIFNNKDYMIRDNHPTILWNLPRCIANEYISYQALENIKDGLICNNKFECGSFICNPPTVCIFANCLPDMSKLTIDKWKIYTITDLDLCDYVNPLDS